MPAQLTAQQLEARRAAVRKCCRRLYRDRKQAGLCVNCGAPPSGGRVTCDKCYAKSQDTTKRCQRRLYESRSRAGLCTHCGATAVAGYKSCEECKQKVRTRLQRTVKNRLVNGLCRYCSKPAAPDSPLCLEHQEYFRQNERVKRSEWVASGLCTICGGVRDEDGRVVCRSCRQKSNARRNEHRLFCQKHGLCLNCRVPAVTTGKRPLCLDCWFKSIAKLNTGDRKNWTVLRDKWEQQQGRCAYTDQVLIPGKTASVDHITPVTRGGGNEPGNLQWVAFSVNTMKYDRTHEEFVLMCKRVAAKFG